MMLTRRALFGLLAAPAIIRVADLMPVKALWTPPEKKLVFNVLDYGAIGDGVTDDTVAFRAALDAATAVGATVYVPARTFVVSTIRIPVGAALEAKP